jgi:hypothetical protein
MVEKPKLEERIPDWTRHNMLNRQAYHNYYPLFRMYEHYRAIMYRTPHEMELFKYKPSLKYPKSIFFSKIFGIFVSLNLYLYYTRIYEDEFRLREKGYSIS